MAVSVFVCACIAWIWSKNCCWVCKWEVNVWSSITYIQTYTHRKRGIHMCWRTLSHKLTRHTASDCVWLFVAHLCCMFLCQNREKTCLVGKVTNLKTDVLNRCSVCLLCGRRNFLHHSLHSVWIECFFLYTFKIGSLLLHCSQLQCKLLLSVCVTVILLLPLLSRFFIPGIQKKYFFYWSEFTFIYPEFVVLWNPLSVYLTISKDIFRLNCLVFFSSCESWSKKKSVIYQKIGN